MSQMWRCIKHKQTQQIRVFTSWEMIDRCCWSCVSAVCPRRNGAFIYRTISQHYGIGMCGSVGIFFLKHRLYSYRIRSAHGQGMHRKVNSGRIPTLKSIQNVRQFMRKLSFSAARKFCKSFGYSRDFNVKMSACEHFKRPSCSPATVFFLLLHVLQWEILSCQVIVALCNVFATPSLITN